MSVSKWRYTEECNGRPCPGDCDHCSFEPADLISRSDAIEAVIAQRHKAELSDYNFALGLAEDAIRHLPSAEAEWISVSERLPETHTEYVTENPWTQVSIVQDTYQLSDPVLGFGKRGKDHGEDQMMVVWYEDDGYDRTGWITAPDCEDIDVIAWMPLPKPYKGGKK